MSAPHVLEGFREAGEDPDRPGGGWLLHGEVRCTEAGRFFESAESFSEPEAARFRSALCPFCGEDRELVLSDDAFYKGVFGNGPPVPIINVGREGVFVQELEART